MTRYYIAAAALLILLGADRVVAQELALERGALPVWDGCPPGGDQNTKSTTLVQRQEAEGLAAAATQSAILGDNAAALDYLRRASLLDPSSLEITYHLARTLQELGRTGEALATYCRYATLGSDAPEIQDVRERITALSAATVTSAASLAFKTGIAHFDARRLAEAEAAFSRAIVAAPAWTAPIYNRAVTRVALGRRDAASADARVYVNLGGDPAQVAGLVAVGAAAAPSSNAGSVLVAGLVVPGLGHFVTNRPAMGALVLGAAGAALTVGLSVQRMEVDCLSPPVDGRCPTEQVLRERTERPYLMPAIGVAVVAGVLGALDAYRTARRRGESTIEGGARTGALDLAVSAIVALSEIQLQKHEVRVELVRLRF